MRYETRQDETTPWRWWRVALEVGAVVTAVLAASQIERLAPPGVLLVALATTAFVLLLRLLPDSDATAWPRLPAPERGGRRAEIYRLSWQLGRERDVAPAATARLADTVALLRAAAPPEDHAELDTLAARLAHRPNRDLLVEVLTDLEAYLTRLAAARSVGGPSGSHRRLPSATTTIPRSPA